ncbi:MAG: hypothetical protein J6A26_01815 [Oscillospiraceae bacterium]|nr:hypothetical protein [Oscillospiraceae bacterium]
MTFENLANLVADEFRRTMAEEGFETFSEMKKCYMWDANDIKEEVSTIVDEISNKAWEATHNTSETAFVADDYSFVQIGIFDEMSWREFKKLVFGFLK